MSDHAVHGDDPGALDNPQIRSVFTSDESEELDRRLMVELVPGLTDLRYAWESSLPPQTLPADFVQPLFEFLDSLKVHFKDDVNVVNHIEDEISLLDDWIGENEPWGIDYDPELLDFDEIPENPRSSRSIFDDIDADDAIGND